MHRAFAIPLAACLLFACESPPEFKVFGELYLPEELGRFVTEDRRDHECLKQAVRRSRDFLTEKGFVPADYSFRGVRVWVHGTTLVQPSGEHTLGETYAHGDEIHVERYLRALAHEYFHSYRLRALGVDESEEAGHGGWGGAYAIIESLEWELDRVACH